MKFTQTSHSIRYVYQNYMKVDLFKEKMKQ